MPDTFTWRTDAGARRAHQPKTREAEFGDGYSQRAAKGINNDPDAWSVKFSGRDKAEADAIMDFLVAHGGTTAFTWSTPDGKITGLYTCDDYSRDLEDEDGEQNAVSGTFKRRYGG